MSNSIINSSNATKFMETEHGVIYAFDLLKTTSYQFENWLIILRFYI